MNNNNEITKHEADIAQFRFALIAPVVQGLIQSLRRPVSMITFAAFESFSYRSQKKSPPDAGKKLSIVFALITCLLSVHGTRASRILASFLKNRKAYCHHTRVKRVQCTRFVTSRRIYCYYKKADKLCQSETVPI